MSGRAYFFSHIATIRNQPVDLTIGTLGFVPTNIFLWKRVTKFPQWPSALIGLGFNKMNADYRLLAWPWIVI